MKKKTQMKEKNKKTKMFCFDYQDHITKAKGQICSYIFRLKSHIIKQKQNKKSSVMRKLQIAVTHACLPVFTHSGSHTSLTVLTPGFYPHLAVSVLLSTSGELTLLSVNIHVKYSQRKIYCEKTSAEERKNLHFYIRKTQYWTDKKKQR